MSLLNANGLQVRRGPQTVLHDVDLDIDPGDVVAVVGPNGAGKSTLLETLGGRLKPTAGTVERHGRIATVMQSPGLARRSARANVELALAWWGVPRQQRRSRALDALAQMRADHLSDRPALALSGGERRRVHLARAVALKPDILLLDEPFAGLDPESRAAVCDDASSALRTSAGAVVIVVHDRAEAWAMADRLVVMIRGRIVAEGKPHEVLARPPSAAVARFLGYDGELRLDNALLLTRPTHVRIDPTGELEATILRVVPIEDGAKLELATTQGTLRAVVPDRTLRTDDQVQVRVSGGIRFPIE